MRLIQLKKKTLDKSVRRIIKRMTNRFDDAGKTSRPRRKPAVDYG